MKIKIKINEYMFDVNGFFSKKRIQGKWVLLYFELFYIYSTERLTKKVVLRGKFNVTDDYIFLFVCDLVCVYSVISMVIFIYKLISIKFKRTTVQKWNSRNWMHLHIIIIKVKPHTILSPAAKKWCTTQHFVNRLQMHEMSPK